MQSTQCCVSQRSKTAKKIIISMKHMQ